MAEFTVGLRQEGYPIPSNFSLRIQPQVLYTVGSKQERIDNFHDKKAYSVYATIYIKRKVGNHPYIQLNNIETVGVQGGWWSA